jgi:hypothetical protein
MSRISGFGSSPGPLIDIVTLIGFAVKSSDLPIVEMFVFNGLASWPGGKFGPFFVNVTMPRQRAIQ